MASGIGSTTRRPHVWKPAADVASARTILLLHGTGADERDLLGLGKALDPDAAEMTGHALMEFKQ